MVLGVLILGGGLWGSSNPLRLSLLLGRFRLQLRGVHEIRLNGLHAYVKDGCPAASDPRICTCVALIHGLGDSALTWSELLLRPQAQWPPNTRLVAIDLPGSAGSPPPRVFSDYRVRRQAAAVSDALAPLCPSWTVVGNSLGGWIGAWMALDRPDEVRNLMLVDSAGLAGEVDEPKIRRFFVDTTVDSARDFLAALFAHPPRLPAYILWNLAREIRGRGLGSVVGAQTRDDLLDGSVGALKPPTLVFWGDTDGIFSVSEGKRMASLIPGSIWREEPDCGHLPQLDCPSAVIRSIAELVRR